MNQPDSELWRRRHRDFALVRLLGLAFFVAGVFIAFTDLARPGGWPLVGGLLAISGALDAVFAPRLLKKLWQQQDR